MKESSHRKAAETFAGHWAGKGYEKGETQVFWLTLLRDVLGVDKPERLLNFEERLKVDHTNFMDVRIPSSRVLIEQKSINKDLLERIRQSDGMKITPYQQAKRYIVDLPVSEHPRWVVTCNFAEFHIYDMENPKGEPEKILLSDLPAQWHRLRFLVENDINAETIRVQTEVSVKAGAIVGELYSLLYNGYINPSSQESQHALNKLCVRLVFCLYAEDTDIFGKRDAVHDYLVQYRNRPSDFREAIKKLFKVLDTPLPDRDPYLDDVLARFPYVNGGLFAGEIEIPRFSREFIDMFLDKASLGFDWSPISPTIFGAVFESTLNPSTRHDGGMHYTSIDNIHRVIDPLFLNSLRDRLTEIVHIHDNRRRLRELKDFRVDLGKMTFLDPACGSGNFLTETYMSLRRLENDAIREERRDYRELNLGDDQSSIQVSIGQFFGIEINDFAVAVAQTALWIAECKMMLETEDILGVTDAVLPLKNYQTIHEANALTLDWNTVVDKSRLNYIIGNPPFVGARVMSKNQKADLTALLGKKWPGVGNLDFVAGWYKKSADMMKGTSIRAALVSTNSICQGEQTANLWLPLLADGIHIDFARRTFRWDSESADMAHVHCVIVGFSHAPNKAPRIIYDGDTAIVANNINPYLVDGPAIIVTSRSQAICPCPKIGIGNKPIDGGNYLFTADERDEFIKREPAAAKYFHPWYGAQEFINRNPRYCLWLGDCSPRELRSMPACLERLERVRAYRLASPSEGTRKLADRPTRFHVENFPASDFLLIPKTSSERRRYIPIGFMTPYNFASDLVFIVPDASLYHFGVLTSATHMAWMRAVGGRLETRYRYSKDVVYNNFPWPEPTESQRQAIEDAAKAILDARDRFPDCSLADLYDDLTMPYELRRAHDECDRLVAKAYGFHASLSDEDTVSRLLEIYASLIN